MNVNIVILMEVATIFIYFLLVHVMHPSLARTKLISYMKIYINFPYTLFKQIMNTRIAISAFSCRKYESIRVDGFVLSYGRVRSGEQN